MQLSLSVAAPRFNSQNLAGSNAAGEYAENEVRKDFTLSERVAILKTLDRHAHGGDRGSDQEQTVALDAREAATRAGLGNRETARQATLVVDKGTPALVDAMDAGKLGRPVRLTEANLRNRP